MSFSLAFSNVDTALQSIARIINQFKDVTGFYTTKSLSDVTKLTRVEPLTVISRDCLSLEYMKDINQSLLSMFCAYYLQAISILTRVDHVEVIRVLDRLNPDRDETGFLMGEKVSRESMLRSVRSHEHALPNPRRMALEANSRDLVDDHNFDQKNKNEKVLLEMANLSVGKLIHVDIAFDGRKASEKPEGEDSVDSKVTIPINIRLMVSSIPNLTAQHLLTIKKEDTSLVERYHSWRSGRIGFINDMIFCQDLIDEYKRAMISDDSGTMAEIIRRVNNAKKFGLLTKNPSLVAASNIFVISEEIARHVESELGGKLNDPKIREKAFESTYAMFIVVVDREWERVTFYTRNISSHTELSIAELKTASKGSGPDIADIMKAYNMGSAPTF